MCVWLYVTILFLPRGTNVVTLVGGTFYVRGVEEDDVSQPNKFSSEARILRGQLALKL